MPIWPNPSDRFYEGPATYRLIVYGRNYCGKTFYFKNRMRCHKSAGKKWKQFFEKHGHVPDVCQAIDDNWDDVVIIICKKYPKKNKDNPDDVNFMNEREKKVIAFYDSFQNGLNMNEGGAPCPLPYQRTPEKNQAISIRMKGNCNGKGNKGKKRTTAMNQANRERNSKRIKATKGDKTWIFKSALEAAEILSKEFGGKFYNSHIGQAAMGKWGKKKTVYKGITFNFD